MKKVRCPVVTKYAHQLIPVSIDACKRISIKTAGDDNRQEAGREEQRHCLCDAVLNVTQSLLQQRQQDSFYSKPPSSSSSSSSHPSLSKGGEPGVGSANPELTLELDMPWMTSALAVALKAVLAARELSVNSSLPARRETELTHPSSIYFPVPVLSHDVLPSVALVGNAIAVLHGAVLGLTRDSAVIRNCVPMKE